MIIDDIYIYIIYIILIIHMCKVLAAPSSPEPASPGAFHHGSFCCAENFEQRSRRVDMLGNEPSPKSLKSLDWKGTSIYRKTWGFPIKIEGFPWLSCHVSLKPMPFPIKLLRFPVVFPTALARPGLVRRPRALLLVLSSGQC